MRVALYIYCIIRTAAPIALKKACGIAIHPEIAMALMPELGSPSRSPSFDLEDHWTGRPALMSPGVDCCSPRELVEAPVTAMRSGCELHPPLSQPVALQPTPRQSSLASYSLHSPQMPSLVVTNWKPTISSRPSSGVGGIRIKTPRKTTRPAMSTIIPSLRPPIQDLDHDPSSAQDLAPWSDGSEDESGLADQKRRRQLIAPLSGSTCGESTGDSARTAMHIRAANLSAANLSAPPEPAPAPAPEPAAPTLSVPEMVISRMLQRELRPPRKAIKSSSEEETASGERSEGKPRAAVAAGADTAATDSTRLGVGLHFPPPPPPPLPPQPLPTRQATLSVVPAKGERKGLLGSTLSLSRRSQLGSQGRGEREKDEGEREGEREAGEVKDEGLALRGGSLLPPAPADEMLAPPASKASELSVLVPSYAAEELSVPVAPQGVAAELATVPLESAQEPVGESSNPEPLDADVGHDGKEAAARSADQVTPLSESPPPRANSPFSRVHGRAFRDDREQGTSEGATLSRPSGAQLLVLNVPTHTPSRRFVDAVYPRGASIGPAGLMQASSPREHPFLLPRVYDLSDSQMRSALRVQQMHPAAAGQMAATGQAAAAQPAGSAGHVSAGFHPTQPHLTSPPKAVVKANLPPKASASPPKACAATLSPPKATAAKLSQPKATTTTATASCAGSSNVVPLAPPNTAASRPDSSFRRRPSRGATPVQSSRQQQQHEVGKSRPSTSKSRPQSAKYANIVNALLAADDLYMLPARPPKNIQSSSTRIPVPSFANPHDFDSRGPPSAQA